MALWPISSRAMAASVQVPTLERADLASPLGLEGIRELAENLWWSWHPEARRLFARIDPQTWARTRNPIHLLRQTDASRWEALAVDHRFVADTRSLVGDLHAYLDDAEPGLGDDLGGPVAYLCAEFALQESLPVYSGGLGVLAGDLCKTASDARLPMVAVAPYYRRGYFRQRIDGEGRQEHLEPDVDPADIPVRRAAAGSGEPLEVSVELEGRSIRLAVWVAQVGRVPLLLLDADVPGNEPDDRRMTDQLYVAERRTRLIQELLLGVGAARALEALEIRPAVWHLNEGHSALVLLERARVVQAAEPGLDAVSALRRAGRDMAMTLHTPVPAGNERYEPDLALEVLADAMNAIRPGTGRPARPGTRTGGRERDLVRPDRVRAADGGQRQRREPAPRPDRDRHLGVVARTPRAGHHQRGARGHLAGGAGADRGVPRDRGRGAGSRAVGRPRRAEAADDRLPGRAADPPGGAPRSGAGIGR